MQASIVTLALLMAVGGTKLELRFTTNECGLVGFHGGADFIQHGGMIGRDVEPLGENASGLSKGRGMVTDANGNLFLTGTNYRDSHFIN